MKKYTLFTYGTLMNEEIFSRLISGRFSKTNARLEGFRRACVIGAHYPAITRDPTMSVEGIVLIGLDGSQMEQLDRFEGECYRREQVSVVTLEAGLLEAETYVLKPKYKKQLSNKTWSNEAFRTQHMQQFIERCLR